MTRALILALSICFTAQASIVTGKLSERGEIRLQVPAENEPIAKVTTAADGTFTVRAERNGLTFAHFSGADPHRRIVALFLRRSEPVKLELRWRGNDATVTFAPPEGFDARFARIHDQMLRRRDKSAAARKAHIGAGKPTHTFVYDWASDTKELSRAIDAETNATLRQALLISYLDLGFTSYGAEIKKAVAERALAEIEPTSTLWSIEPALLPLALRSSHSERRYAKYVEQLIAHHPDAWTRKVVANTASPSRRIMAGKSVPQFQLTSFDDGTVKYTPAALRGKVLLLDFWATYCAPCAEELPNLNEAYARHKRQGFEILSVSLDDQRETVARFQRSGHRMPWLNALLEGGTKNPLLKTFEIVGIPRAILVDRRGVIIATDGELRGRNLERTLARAMEMK